MGSSYTPRKPTIVTVGLKPELARALEPVKQSIEMLTGARVGTPELYGLPQKTSGMALIGKVNEIISRLNASGAYKLQKETSEGVMADVGIQRDEFDKGFDTLSGQVEEALAQVKTLVDTKVSRAGDTMTGSLKFDWGAYIGKSSPSGLDLFAGASDKNPGLALYANGVAAANGDFLLRAANLSDLTDLRGTAAGVLSWGGAFKALTLEATSDRRLKTRISHKTKVDLSGLKAYKYKFKGKKGMHVGLLAQDVQAVLPEAVAEDANGYLLLDYNAVVAVLVEEVARLRKEVDCLKGQANGNGHSH